MISTIAFLGRASDRIEGHPQFRMIDIESVEAFDEKTFVSHIPVRHWDRESTDNALLKIPNGHFVVIFGRLESHPKLGLYVLAEPFQYFSSNLAIHKLYSKEESQE